MGIGNNAVRLLFLIVSKPVPLPLSLTTYSNPSVSVIFNAPPIADPVIPVILVALPQVILMGISATSYLLTEYEVGLILS